MTKQDTIPVITIDGPSGVGKGTVAQLIARQLSWRFLDSGALYRVLALAAQQHGVELDNEVALEVLASHLDVHFNTLEISQPARVILEGDDVTDTIRGEQCGEAASQIAALPGVRKALIDRQRAFRDAPGLVADGRDMGTIIFPDAELKVYLDASTEIRAQRRYEQLKEKGINVNLDAILTELKARDGRDKNRAVAPLKPAPDAMVIDTSEMSIDAVLQQILQETQQRFAAVIER